jgi:hypothetical protein
MTIALLCECQGSLLERASDALPSICWHDTERHTFASRSSVWTSMTRSEAMLSMMPELHLYSVMKPPENREVSPLSTVVYTIVS